MNNQKAKVLSVDTSGGIPRVYYLPGQGTFPYATDPSLVGKMVQLDGGIVSTTGHTIVHAARLEDGTRILFDPEQLEIVEA